MYAKEVDAVKEARCEAEGIKGREKLIVWQDVSKELYDAASAERKDAVRKRIENEDLEDLEKANTPVHYLRLVSVRIAIPLPQLKISPAISRSSLR